MAPKGTHCCGAVVACGAKMQAVSVERLLSGLDCTGNIGVVILSRL